MVCTDIMRHLSDRLCSVQQTQRAAQHRQHTVRSRSTQQQAQLLLLLPQHTSSAAHSSTTSHQQQRSSSSSMQQQQQCSSSSSSSSTHQQHSSMAAWQCSSTVCSSSAHRGRGPAEAGEGQEGEDRAHRTPQPESGEGHRKHVQGRVLDRDVMIELLMVEVVKPPSAPFSLGMIGPRCLVTDERSHLPQPQSPLLARQEAEQRRQQATHPQANLPLCTLPPLTQFVATAYSVPASGRSFMPG